MATWFDESRLDNERAIGAADLRPAHCWPSPARGSAARWARPRRLIEEAVSAALAGPAPCGDRRRTPTPACCGRCWSRGARCRSSRGPAPPCPAGPASLDLVVVLAPRAPTPGRRPRSPRPYAAAARWWSRARPDRWSPSTRPAGGARSCRPRRRDQLATAVAMLTFLDRVSLGPAADPEQVANALDEVATSLLAAPRHRGQPRQGAGDRAWPTPTRWCGAARCSPPAPRRRGRRVHPPGQRPRGPRRGTPSTCCRSWRRPAARRLRRPVRGGGRRARPVLLVLDDGAEDRRRTRAARSTRAAADRARRPGGERDDRGSERGGPAASLLLSGTAHQRVPPAWASPRTERSGTDHRGQRPLHPCRRPVTVASKPRTRDPWFDNAKMALVTLVVRRALHHRCCPSTGLNDALSTTSSTPGTCRRSSWSPATCPAPSSGSAAGCGAGPHRRRALRHLRVRPRAVPDLRRRRASWRTCSPIRTGRCGTSPPSSSGAC